MSKKPTPNALAQQVPHDHLLYIIKALEDEIERIRTANDISRKEKQELLPPLVNIWQIYKTAAQMEETVLLLCSIR